MNTSKSISRFDYKRTETKSPLKFPPIQTRQKDSSATNGFLSPTHNLLYVPRNEIKLYGKLHSQPVLIRFIPFFSSFSIYEDVRIEMLRAKMNHRALWPRTFLISPRDSASLQPRTFFDFWCRLLFPLGRRLDACWPTLADLPSWTYPRGPIFEDLPWRTYPSRLTLANLPLYSWRPLKDGESDSNLCNIRP